MPQVIRIVNNIYNDDEMFQEEFSKVYDNEDIQEQEDTQHQTDSQTNSTWQFIFYFAFATFYLVFAI